MKLGLREWRASTKSKLEKPEVWVQVSYVYYYNMPSVKILGMW